MNFNNQDYHWQTKNDEIERVLQPSLFSTFDHERSKIVFEIARCLEKGKKRIL